MRYTVGPKGQVVIAKEIRDHRRRRDHVLEVVEHQEDVLVDQVKHEGVRQRLLSPFADAQLLGDRRGHERRITQRGKRDEGPAPGEIRRRPLGDGEREARLAGAPPRRSR